MGQGRVGRDENGDGMVSVAETGCSQVSSLEEEHTVSFRSNNTTRPPLSPVAR